ncbi:MAG: M60 family metallopeptidase [Prevotellaceae bacterium]|jgi:hypothetical protein|nr:M60 family metallopeptidase [Prevotellaceae bacterium]
MKYLYSILFFSLLLCCASCKDDKEPAVPEFSIEASDLLHDVTAEAAVLFVPVKTNLAATDWSVTATASWCTAMQSNNASGNGISIVVQANEGIEVREAAVKVASTVQSYTIHVRQLGSQPVILLKEANPTIDAGGGELKVTVTSNVAYTVSLSENSEWLAETPHTRTMTNKVYTYQVSENRSYDKRTATLTYTCTDDPNVTALCTVTQQAKDGSMSSVEVEGDIKIKVQSGKDSEHQPGAGIENTFDGNIESGDYHSIWQQPANFPVTLEYFFDSRGEDMDYIIYYSRSGNGNFGQFDLYLATVDQPEYTLYGSYDFQQKHAPSRVAFATRQEKVTAVKFSVRSGLGDFVSCREMEFYRYNDHPAINARLLTVFTDITCSELREDATPEAINALPGYFAQLGFALYNNSYDEWEKEFRVQRYQPYSVPEEWAATLLTKKYGNLDNPTGIYVEAGDSIVVLVGDTYGHQLSLQCIGDETAGGDTPYLQTAAGGETFFLSQGVNKLGFAQKGMLFVMYNTDIASPTAKPVKIHIPPGSGKVSGYFDVATHQTNDRYKELIDKAGYKYFCVRGSRIMFYFHTQQMKDAVPYDILSAIHLWDDIIGWQQELMGIEEVHPSRFNNHIFAISPEGSYMWASDYRIGFVYTYLKNILLKENVMAAKDNAWGPAHEIGHIHQAAINWPTCTESSNNLFSNYVLYKLGKYCSRGTELSGVAKSRCEYDEVWANMGSASGVAVNEIHMRMHWQLWNYYHRCGYMPDFWQKLFKALRKEPLNGNRSPGHAQLLFAMTASRIANENLTDFFDFWGFLTPVNTEVDDYGKYPYTVTDAMIDEAKHYMAQFPAPRHAFYYLEDRKEGDVGIESYKPGDVGYYTRFAENTRITKEVSCTRSGRTVSIRNGDEAVAFEVRKDGRRIYFSNFYTFTVPDNIPLDGTEIYAVQADGTRIKAKE